MLLSLIMMVSLLAACGGNASNSPGEGAAPEPSDTQGGSETITLDIFVDQPWWPVKDWSGPVPEEITKRTGVKLNVTVASDEKQLPLMIASGDLPDLVLTSEQFNRMSDPTLSYDWQSLIDQYAPDFEIAQERIGVNTAADGTFYSVKNNFSTEEEWKANEAYALTSGAAITYRADILAELGNPEIRTLDDLKNVFIDVKEKYPDLVPLVLNPTPTWAKGYFQLNFGTAMKGFVEDENDNLVHSLRTESLLNMYLYMNDLYRNGVIKAETYAYQNEDQAKSMATSGKAFAYAWTTNGADMLNAATEGTGMEWANLPMVLSDDFAHVRRDTGWQGVFITKNNKNPEASIKFMQYLLSEEGQRLAMWGIEGEHWNMSADGGYPEFTYTRADDEVRNQLGVYWWGLMGGSAVTELVGNFVPGTAMTASNQELMANTTFKPATGMVVPAPDSREQVILSNIENMVTNEEAKVLMATSEENARAAYANMVEQAERIGLSDLEAWANERYAEVKKNFE